MVEKNKEIKFSNNFKFLFFVIGVVLVMSFVFAEYSVSPSSFSINEDNSSSFFNITINNTVPLAGGNITQINVTIPSTFTFVANTNGTSCNATGDNIFANTSTVLSWSNYTSYLINGSSNNSYFWFNASASTPGTYNFTVAISNNTGTNYTNLTVSVADITAPVLGWGDASNPAPDSIVVTFTGGEGTCTTVGEGAITTTTSTLTVTGLVCGGTSYNYKITCTDSSGNSGSTSEKAFTTGSCPSSAPSLSSTTSFYTKTHVVSSEQFVEGYTKQIAVKNRMKVRIGNTYHHVGVKELTETSATIEIASDPVEVNLDVGEEVKIDLTADGIYDIYIILNSISGSKADITIQSISEAIPEGGSSIETTGEDLTGGTTQGQEETSQEESNLTWLWILISVVAGVVIVGIVFIKKSKKQ